MQRTPDYYDFCGVRLFVADLHIKILESGKEHIPSPIHRSFLLALIRRFPEIVTYEDLWKEVWRSSMEMSDTDLRNIQTTKGQLTLWFRDKIQRNLPVEVEPGKGYRLDCEVTPGWMQSELEITDHDYQNNKSEYTGEEPPNPRFQMELLTNTNSNAKVETWTQLFYAHTKYIIAVSFCYGFLFFIAAILEIAYQFDIYGKRAVIFALVLMVINFAAIPAAFAVICYRLCRKKSGLLSAVCVLIGAIIISLLLSALFLPFVPITEAQLQTQPAVVAFGKNVLIYFMPLAIVFVLMPFYVVIAKRLKDLKLIEKMPSDAIFIKTWQLLLIYLGAVVYSLLTTNYLLDRLEAENDYHALFTGLLLLRFVVCFGLGLISLIWYYVQLNKGEDLRD